MIGRLEMFGFNFYAAENVGVIADFVLNDEVKDGEVIPLMVTPNVDQIVRLNRPENHGLREELKKARWILPDGQPVIAISRIKYGKQGLPARLTGSDFFPEMWSRLKQRESIKVMFILPKPDLGERFLKERPNTVYYAPPFFNVHDKNEFEEVMQQVMQQFDGVDSPKYVFIGIGFVKQERVALELFKRLRDQGKPLPKAFLLGASFEFYWGTKKRAPKFYQKAGIEFVHRIIQEPRRLAKRYLWDDLPFFGIAFKELMRKRE
jgi:N-acetylglucosaminyldiphosphoundecaprenol N-acetyl-beta-D-mannosaminyltransferase